MTPEQMRRIAAQRDAESAELNSDAARLRAQAAALDGLLDPLIPMSQRVWRGPAADDFERAVKAHAGRVNQQARALEGVASDFDRQAVSMRCEARQLRQLAAAAAESDMIAGGWRG